MSKNLITLQAQRLKSILIRSNGWDYKGRICICYQLMIRQSVTEKNIKKAVKSTNTNNSKLELPKMQVI